MAKMQKIVPNLWFDTEEIAPVDGRSDSCHRIRRSTERTDYLHQCLNADECKSCCH
jgi:hypothetical protein